MNTKQLAEEVTVVTGESEGIGAAIAKLMKRRNVINIIERFQTQHARLEEMKNFHASTNGAVAVDAPDKNGMPKKSIFETEEVQVLAVAVPDSTQWSPPHDVLIGQPSLIPLTE